MKKEIENVTHLPIRQQYWTDLSGAKDSVIFTITKQVMFNLILFVFVGSIASYIHIS